MKWKPSRPILLALAIVAVVVALPAGNWVGRWVGGAPSDESPLDRAHRLCGRRGLDAGEVGRLIEEVRHSTLSRQENIEPFLDTFEDPSDAELRMPCAGAVMGEPKATRRGR